MYQSQVTLNAEAGTTYYIEVNGANGSDVGDFVLGNEWTLRFALAMIDILERFPVLTASLFRCRSPG